MTEYKPNSHKYKVEQAAAQRERKKMDKVVSGKVKTKKKGELRKLTDVFISEDVGNVKSYILMDVLLPSIKNAVWEVITGALDMSLFGGSGRTKKGTNASRVSYRSYYDNGRDHRRDSAPRTRTGYDYDDIVLESRGEADEVLSQLEAAIDMYGMVSVADLYDLVGITGNYTDNKYGWTNLRNAEAVRVRDGYLLKMPKALPLNQ